MKIEGSHELRARRERVFAVLVDPDVLQRCIPGCERLEKTGENSYATTLRTGVGSIKGVFTGNVRLEDVRPPEHYRIVVDGKGQPGFLKGTGDLDLEQRDEITTIAYAGDVQVGGTIASVGQRMIQGSAKMMASQFFTAIEVEAQTGAGESPPEHGFFRTTLRWFSGWLRRLFRTAPIAVLLVVSIPLRVSAQEALYKTGAYTLTTSGVRQGRFEASAKSRTEIVSNYRTEYDEDLELKFLVNGTLHGIAGYESNRLFFNSRHDRVVSPVYVFGQRESSDFAGRGEGENQDGVTTVTLRVDMRPVLEAFKRQGYYEFYDTRRVAPGEFQGVYVTGNTPPLASELAKPPFPSRFALTDPDKNGIYEITIDFDTKSSPDNSRMSPGAWRLQRDISHLPRYESSQILMDALYAMSLEEVVLNIRPDNTFMAGKLWDGVWTRDISYSIILSLAILAPGVAKESLMRKVSDGRIVQDTGTGGSWPVSTDRMVWSLAAWEVYTVTGDKKWLNTAYQIIKKSAAADLENVRAPNNLFFGESSFMDWREQSYPRWMEPKDIYASQCLSTNAVHFQTYQILAQMAQILGQPAGEYTAVAASLKTAINSQFWMPDKGYFGEFFYGRTYPSLSPRSESLGEVLSVLFDIADADRQKRIISSTPIVDLGVPDFHPQIPNMPPYHNNAIWPFVVGYWTWASAKVRNVAAVEHGLGSIYRQAALFATNKENMTATTGDTATMLNSDRQLWSVAANLATVHRIFFGMSFEPDRLVLKPFIPKTYKDSRTLKNFTYRAATLDITIDGHGDEIKSITLDGKNLATAVIPGDITGKHTLVISMANNDLPTSTITNVAVDFSPETPVATVSGANLTWNAVEGARTYVIFENGKKISETSENTFALPNATYAEYQVLAVDSRGLQSFLSAPAEVSPSAGKIEIEAEANSGAAAAQFPGHSGKGYIKLDKTQNLAIDYRARISKPGTYSIKFRYANGNGPVNTENKCAIRTLRVDGKRVGAVVMPQRGTVWNDWGYSNSHIIDLTEGEHILRIAFEESDENMNGAVNEALLDKIELTLVSGR
jgi:carbon monoxide dehydrogenase subunit G